MGFHHRVEPVAVIALPRIANRVSDDTFAHSSRLALDFTLPLLFLHWGTTPSDR